ncbi:MAG TPA: ion transporter [Hyphomonadaceae bacterium]|nr:ion transporter [Hyphomonadaceae bacterium]
MVTPEIASAAAPRRRSLRALLRHLYLGDSASAQRFRWLLVALDVAIIAFFFAGPFLPETAWVLALDYAIAVFLVLDVLARLTVPPRLKWGWFRPLVAIDLIVIASLLFPGAFGNFGFLRVLRGVSFWHSPLVENTLRRRVKWFARHEQVIDAAVNLVTALFLMTGLVYATQVKINPAVGNYLDAFYFTVTTITTTGFGDITLKGSWGRLLSIGIMLVGVTLFVRLGQALFTGGKVKHRCPQCALLDHDYDAVHCKACGIVLDIPNHG